MFSFSRRDLRVETVSPPSPRVIIMRPLKRLAGLLTRRLPRQGHFISPLLKEVDRTGGTAAAELRSCGGVPESRG